MLSLEQDPVNEQEDDLSDFLESDGEDHDPQTEWLPHKRQRLNEDNEDASTSGDESEHESDDDDEIDVEVDLVDTPRPRRDGARGRTYEEE